MDDNSNSLRAKAKEELRQGKKIDTSLYETDLKVLVEELSIYQIELEHQNQELILSQDHLQQSNDRYLDLFDNAPIGYLIVDLYGVIKGINQTACSLLERNKTEFIENKITKFIHPDYQDIYYLYFQSLIKQKQYQPCDIKLRKAYNSFFYARIQGIRQSQLKSEEPEFRLAIIDVTSQKEMELKLLAAKALTEQSEERFQLLFNKAPLGYQSLDFDGNFIEVNQQWLDTLGYERDEVIGKWFGDFLPPMYQDGFRERFPIFKAQGHIHSEFEMIHKNGSILFIAFDGKIGNDEQGNFKQTHCILQDITEKKRAETILCESEERYRLLADNVPDIIYSLNGEGNIVAINSSAFERYGYTEQDAKGMPFLRFVYPEDRDTVLNSFYQALEEQRNYTQGLQLRIAAKNGEVFWFELNSKARFSSNGAYLGEDGVLRDITDRKKAEEALVESGNKYHELFSLIRLMSDTMPDLMWAKDLNKKYIFVNEAICNLLLQAKDKEEPIGKDDLFFAKRERELHPDDPQWYTFDKMCKDSDAETLKQMKQIQFDEYGNVKGKFLYLDVHKAPLITKEGKLIGVVGSARDVTQQKLAEAVVVESEERLKTLINATPDLICFKDGQGRWLISNDSNLELFCLKSVEYFGKTDAELAEFTDPIYKEAFLSCMQTDENAWKAMGISINEETITTTKGIKKIYDIIKVPVFEPDGSRKALVVLARDITERKKVSEELIIAKEHAEESDRLKSAFLANMSHEIRTPMNGILGFAEVLKDPDLSGDQQQEYIDIIEKSGARMLNIINDIVDISKIEAGLMKLDIKESNINEQIEYIYTFFKPEVEAKGMKLSFKNALPAKEAIIKTDREKVYSILTNLVKNAIKYTNEGFIEFGYVSTGSTTAPVSEPVELQFYVKDTGIGIPKDRQEAIFKRFIQADIVDVQARQGAGLGLSITKAYVEMLGGQIWVESDPDSYREGIGSTFYFTLPYNAEPVKETVDQEFAISDKTPQVGKLKILIAEDDKVSEMLLDKTVKMFGKEVLKARTGVEAVEACKNNPDIDLVLMDIQMPEMNGYEATREIRQFNKKVVIIAQTAYGLSGDREKAIEAGCNDYVAKPIKKDELMGLIQKYFKE